MKKYLPLFLLVFIPSIMFAQFAVVSTQPANNSTNVPLSTTISITFNEALDTTALNANGEQTTFANIDSMVSNGYSVDAKTMYANVVLKPNHSYFLAFFYMKAKSGAVITAPHVYYFTTGTNFAPYTVSGTVLSGSTGVSPDSAMVALSTENIMTSKNNGPPPFAAWANVNSNGTYTVPNVANGTYWPIALKDVNHDGKLDPSLGGDVIAFSDSIVISNASITNVNLTFLSFKPKLFHETISAAESLASNNLPVDKVLRRISGYNVDSTGAAQTWEYGYTFNNNTEGKGIRTDVIGSSIYTLDQGYMNWITQLNPINTNLHNVAFSTTVIANAENAGGKAFRLLPHSDTIESRIELSLCDQKYGWFQGGVPNPGTIYWAVAYTQQYQVTNNQSNTIKGKYFLCDLATGAVILMQTMGVKNETVIPEQFMLSQNFPNPFNPATKINFAVSSSGIVTLKVYNILGEEIATLVNERKDAGSYSVSFDGKNVPSGIYFYQLRSGNFVETKKMVLMK